jgi:hypothetical protein
LCTLPAAAREHRLALEQWPVAHVVASELKHIEYP